MYELYWFEGPDDVAVRAMFYRLGVADDQVKRIEVKDTGDGLLPRLVDLDKSNFEVFGKVAILHYLASKYGKLWPKEPQQQSEVMQWLAFACAACELCSQDERATPFLKAMEQRLSCGKHLAEDISIADLSTWACIERARDLSCYPNVKRWVAYIGGGSSSGGPSGGGDDN